MRILMCHNRYKIPGGEDMSTMHEAMLLREAGHEVDLLEYDNDEVEHHGLWRTAADAVWSRRAYREIGAILDSRRFDVLHVQNFFPLLSPSIIYAAGRRGIPVVQSLRNYRLFCANAKLFRDGRTCHDCIRLPVPVFGIIRGCYRNSRAASAVVAAMSGTHRMLGTWTRHVHAFVAVSAFVRDRYAEAGFPIERIHVKANTLGTDPIVTDAVPENRAIYVGRMDVEKGIGVLIKAWRRLNTPAELHLVGDGLPEVEAQIRALAEGDRRVRFRGRLDHPAAMAEVSKSRISVFPALWAEPFGRTAIESMAVGTPALVSAVGGLGEIVGAKGGEAVPPGDIDALVAALIRWLGDPEILGRRRREARRRYDDHFSTRSNLARQLEIYRCAKAVLLDSRPPVQIA